ncbi:MAG: GIN domain-containing protein [Sphingomicrobium sp.]
MRFFLPALTLALMASPVQSAERSFTVTGFTKVRVDGAYKVKVTTNSAPFARASGDASSLDALTMDVQGATLVIHPSRSSWGGYPGEVRKPVEISLGTHDLVSVWVNGAGSVAVDRVRGLSFDFAVEGPGAGSIAAVQVDQLRVNLGGTATASIAGQAPRMSAQVRGSSSLDASSLAIRDAVILAEGPAIVKAAVANTAKVDAYGASSVQLTGSPACTSRVYGSATISGCK